MVYSLLGLALFPQHGTKHIMRHGTRRLQLERALRGSDSLGPAPFRPQKQGQVGMDRRVLEPGPSCIVKGVDSFVPSPELGQRNPEIKVEDADRRVRGDCLSQSRGCDIMVAALKGDYAEKIQTFGVARTETESVLAQVFSILQPAGAEELISFHKHQVLGR
jgi:hypothetical protein